MWSCIAANSADIKTIRFGRGKSGADPILRTGQVSTDARIKTAVHALGAVIPWVVPNGEDAFKATNPYNMMTPTIGFEVSLISQCGAINDYSVEWSDSLENCLRSWYEADPSPSRMG